MTKIKSIIEKNEYHKLKRADLLDFHDDTYKNALLFAARFSGRETLEKIFNLLENDEIDDFIVPDEHKRRFLSLAVIGGKKEVVAYLVENQGYAVGKVDYYNRTPLWFAIERNKPDIFEYLLEQGAIFGDKEEEVFKKSDDFKEYFNTPKCFLFIVGLGDIKLLTLILRHINFTTDNEKKKFIDAKNEEGETALYIAFKKKNNENNNAVKIKMLEIYYKYNTKYATQNDKIRVANSLSTNPPTTYEGGASKAFEKCLSQYRSYAQNREIQILRHVSTQLYFYLKTIQSETFKDLVEVQTMHLEYGDNNYLFLSANKHTITKNIVNFVSNIEILKQKITAKYTFNNNDYNEGKIRSERFSKKLTLRVFKQDINIPGDPQKKDHKHATTVANILKTGEVVPLHIEVVDHKLTEATLKILEYYFKNKSNKIFILVTGNLTPETAYKERHAEEFLTDIAEYAFLLSEKENKNVYSSIAGKKRPCIGCSGRMEDKIDTFGKKPGLFWSHTIKHQSNLSAFNTIQILITKPSYITVCKDGVNTHTVTDCDSGSDSECEEPNNNNHPQAN